MVDKLRGTKKSKNKRAEQEIASLIRQAVKVKAGYDYPSAIELFDQALHGLDQLSRKNGADEAYLLEDRYSIHDGRAECFNWMGETNQEIAETLVLSINTVKRHTSSIYGKLGVSNRTQAINEARRLDLI